MTTPQKRGAKAFLALVLVVALGLGATACTKEAIAQAVIVDRFGTQSQIAIAIATCESRLQATATSPDGNNIGLFQINRVHAGWIRSQLGYTYGQLIDPWKNARVAKILYDQSGWRPWHGTCGGRLGI